MKLKQILTVALIASIFLSCGNKASNTSNKKDEETNSKDVKFEYLIEKFADKKIVRYKIPSWEKLSLKQKKYAYYLTQAGYAGREIVYDQNYRHNLAIKRTLETIYTTYKGDKDNDNWKGLEKYLKEIWFASGIHHHYSKAKFVPEFEQGYLEGLIKETGAKKLNEDAMKAIFDPTYDAKMVDKSDGIDIVKESAVNVFVPEMTQQKAEDYYKSIKNKNDKTPISYGLNSKLMLDENGKVYESRYKADGLYGAAIKEIVKWLELAKGVAENENQAKALGLLIQYYNTGDLKVWDEYNILWCKTIHGDVDYINSFIEVYSDPMGYKGFYETVVQIKDFKMTEIMSVVASNVQWFEDNSTIMQNHKKKNVTGVSYKVVDVVGESGDASPSTPIGVNLPNSNWIRATHGSKSVSLGNIISAYDGAGGSGILNEFANDKNEIARSKKHGKTAGKMHTALHEVVGHASGQLNPGIGTPKETLKKYSSTLEEARADLVGLYYIMDQKLIDLKLVESKEVGKAEYDGYIRNGLMTQMMRLKMGDVIEEAHMRNRQLVAAWAFEKGSAENVISKIKRDGKTFFKINDYTKLRALFGELLKEIQRIKSEGDYEAGKSLVENYGVQVDKEIHAEVLKRVKPLNIAPYGGFVNPTLIPINDDSGNITDFKIEYQGYSEQMLDYAKRFGFLPDYN